MPKRYRRPTEAEMVCAEAYQVVGSLLDDLCVFETDAAVKTLDNLSQACRVHKDVLPWPSFATPPAPEGAEAGEA